MRESFHRNLTSTNLGKHRVIQVIYDTSGLFPCRPGRLNSRAGLCLGRQITGTLAQERSHGTHSVSFPVYTGSVLLVEILPPQ